MKGGREEIIYIEREKEREGERERDRYATRMTPALRWAAMRAILIFH